MKTDDLITLLATGAGAAPRRPVAVRLGPALAVGLAAALLLAQGWPLRPWATGTHGAVLAAKLSFGAAVALAALVLAARAARPLAAPLGAWARAGWLLPPLALVAAVAVLAMLAPEASAAPSGGPGSGLACAVATALLALPMLAAGFWALRGLAPVRPVRAGAALGLLAGGVGVLAYALVCPEAAPGFVALWYSLAMVTPAALGALLGPRLLRW